MIETFVAFFAGISILWYAGILFLIATMFYGDDNWRSGIVAFIIAFALYWWFVGINWTQDWKTLLIGLAAYFGIGAVWSVIKWVSTLFKIKRVIRQIKTQYPNASMDDLARKVERSMSENGFGWFVHEQFGDNDRWQPSMEKGSVREKLISWITFWPFSFFNYLFYNILSDIANWLFSLFKGTYRMLANMILGSV